MQNQNEHYTPHGYQRPLLYAHAGIRAIQANGAVEIVTEGRAQKERRIIVFVDESGLSERPHRKRTWAPKGRTPVLQYHFTWKTLSAVADITYWNFYFQLFAGAICSPQVIEFLRHLLWHLGGKVLIVWDGLPAHRTRAVWEFVRQQRGRIWLEFLPAYAPELNPTEYIWGHLKQHELPNFCPKDLGELSGQAVRALRRMRRRPSLVVAFWKQADPTVAVL